MLAPRSGEDDLPKFSMNIRNERLSDSECEIVVSCQMCGCECFTNCWSTEIFTTWQPSPGFPENAPKMRTFPDSCSWVEENALLMSGVRKRQRHLELLTAKRRCEAIASPSMRHCQPMKTLKRTRLCLTKASSASRERIATSPTVSTEGV